MKRILIMVVCLPVFIGFFFIRGVFADDVLEDELFMQALVNDGYQEERIPQVGAAAAIVMDMDSGRVLYEKAATSRRPMASTTKIMTAILAIENGNLEDTVTVSKRASDIWGSKINLKAGQKISLHELLYGLLLNSGNDAAIAIAEHIDGTVEQFLDRMNKKAIELGAVDTCFKSPHGLDAEGHYSTAYDLALIARYALKNPVFSKIVASETATIQNKVLHNTNEMLRAYPGADGVKTGYTGKAGRCLVTSVTRDGWKLISVVLGCPSRFKRAQDSQKILDYAFNLYKPYCMIKAGDIAGKFVVEKGTANYMAVKASESVCLPLKASEYDALERKVYIPDSMEAPLYAGTSVGTVTFSVNGEILGETKLMTCSDIRRKGFFDYLEQLFHVWCRTMKEGIFTGVLTAY